jgi:hypothetical protein
MDEWKNGNGGDFIGFGELGTFGAPASRVLHGRASCWLWQGKGSREVSIWARAGH